jgi:hypothetical protein
MTKNILIIGKIWHLELLIPNSKIPEKSAFEFVVI